MIKIQLRTADTLARIGGDEFGIVLENCSLDSARKIADTVRQATRDNRALEEGRMRLVVQDAVQLPERIRGKRYQEILLRMIDEKGNPMPTATVITAAERF